MKIACTPPITIQPWPLPPVPPCEPGNGGIVPPWLVPTPKPVEPKPPRNGNPGIVPPWLR